MPLRSICVYCGSSSGYSPRIMQIASECGQLLGREGITLIYGGGNVGVMGAVANGVLSQKGEVIGVIPRCLATKEIAHAGLTQLHIVETMHQRKTIMADLADAFVALPGGIGTLEEIFEVLTWYQLGLHQKSCAILNVDGFYDLLLSFLDSASSMGFIRDQHLHSLLVESDFPNLLERIKRETFMRGVESSPGTDIDLR